MKVKIESSKIVKPLYEDGEAPAHAEWVPLSVFDKVTYGEHVGLIFAFRPPNPPTARSSWASPRRSPCTGSGPGGSATGLTGAGRCC